MTNQEPLIRVYVSPSTISAWIEDEWASWEDQQNARAEKKGEGYEVPVGEHVVEILEKQTRKTVIYVTPAEARICIESLGYQGSGGLWDEKSPAYERALDRIMRDLTNDLVKMGEPARV